MKHDFMHSRDVLLYIFCFLTILQVGQFVNVQNKDRPIKTETAFNNINATFRWDAVVLYVLKTKFLSVLSCAELKLKVTYMTWAVGLCRIKTVP